MVFKKFVMSIKFFLILLLFLSIVLYLFDVFQIELKVYGLLSLFETLFFLIAVILSYTVIRLYPDFKTNFTFFFYAYLMWFFGDVIWTYFDVLNIPLPTLSYFDIFYILFYLFLILSFYQNLKPYFKLIKDKKSYNILIFNYVIFICILIVMFFSTSKTKDFDYVINALYPILAFIILTLFIPLLINTYTLESILGRTILVIAISIVILNISDIIYFISYIIDTDILKYNILYIFAGYGFAYSNIFMLEKKWKIYYKVYNKTLPKFINSFSLISTIL